MVSRRSATHAALIVAGAYAIFAGAWIVLSDRVVLFAFGPEVLTYVQTLKGLAFVATTAILLFFTMRLLQMRMGSAIEREMAARGRLDRLHHLLADANEFILRADDERELLQAICEVAVTPGGFSGAWIGTLDQDGSVSVIASYQADSAVQLTTCTREADTCPVRAIVSGADRVVANDLLAALTGPRLEVATRTGVRSLAAVPVYRGGKPVAAFCVFADVAGAFGEEELLLLEQLGADLSIGMERISADNERRQALARLEESEQRYRDLFASAPRPMCIYDLETLEFLDVNDACIAAYGFSREEFLSMTIADIHPAEDVERLLSNVARVSEGLDRAGLWRHVTRDGTVLDVSIVSHVIDWEGRRAEVVLCDDVTAMLQATEARERALARFSALIESSPVPIIALDSETRVTLWNSAAEQVFGWTAEEVLGNPSPLVPDDDRPYVVGVLHELEKGSPIASFQAKRQTKDGRQLDVIVHTVPLISDSGKSEEYVAILLDITERARTEAELEQHRQHLEELVDERTRELNELNEQLLKATRVKSEFLASVSHELRTPLNSIIGFSGVLLQGLAGELNAEQELQINMVRRSGEHLLALINDVLDVSKIEAGQVDIRAEAFDVHESISTVMDALGPTAAEKGLELRREADIDGVVIVSDPLKVQQILFNLVGNAIKFTDDGSVTLRASVDAESVEISVIDTGQGLAPEDQEFVFDEFRQAAQGRDKAGGTGLGLAISRRLARLMGGDVSLTSSPGEGATFTLTLPRRLRGSDS